LKNKFIMKKIFLLLALAAMTQIPARGADAPEATTYQIRNVKYQELLRPRDANNANGTPIVLYPAQPWKCMTWRLQPAGESVFHLKNLFTAKTFCASRDTNAPRTFVTQIPLAKDDGESPAWHFIKLDNGNFEITEGQSTRALTAIEESGSFRIVLAPWKNADEQKWVLEKIDPKDLTL
jgi:hypothetical protein